MQSKIIGIPVTLIFTACPRGPTHIIYYWSVRGIFLGLKFWPKGIFFGLMKDAGVIFWIAKKKAGIFFGYCTFHQLSWCGMFWGIVDNSEVGTFLGIKYEPLLDHPVIKISEWGP